MRSHSRRWATSLTPFGVALLTAGALGYSAFAQNVVPTAPAAAVSDIPATPVTANIDASQTALPISRYEYGMFIEPIGRLVDRTLWAEMLDDRKFYFPITSTPAPQTTGPNQFGMSPQRRWIPIGMPGDVPMDRTSPYVGSQSPIIILDADEPRGLEQDGISIAAGKKYIGRVVIKSSANTAVKLELSWGSTDRDFQASTIDVKNGDWKTYTFGFVSRADSDRAKFTVTSTGQGTIEIGAISLMPADNIDGWRADVVAQLKTVHSGMWRLPGGNYLSDWDWHDAIGPRDQRPPYMDRAWGAMQTNDIGMDDWMTFCRLIDTEPYVTVNAGLGDSNSAAEEVEYINGPASSYWGGLRAKNGHPKPYGVKFWDIGNEPYGSWQIGQTTLPYYTIKHIDFATRMRKVDPTITLLASGAMPDQRAVPGAPLLPNTIANILPKFGAEIDWTGGLFANASDYFDGITEHWYDRAEPRPEASPNEELLEYARQPSNEVLMKADEWDIYRQRYPQIDKKGIFLSIDEYAYTGSSPNLKSAIAYAMVLQEMLRHTGFLRMSAMTTGASLLNILPTASTVNTTGQVYALYGAHFGEGMIPVKVEGDTPWPAPEFPGTDHPQVVAGSSTWPLDIVAALSPNQDKLTVGVVNATLEAQSLILDLRHLTVANAGKAFVLTGPSLTSADTVSEPDLVKVQMRDVSDASTALTIPPAAVEIIEFPVKSN